MNSDQPQPTSTDDMHVMRYLMHTIKGISPVSGGVLGETLEQEYQTAETAEGEPDFNHELEA